MRRILFGFAGVLLIALAGPVQGGTIDFEGLGLTEGQILNSVNTGDNVVGLSTSTSPTGVTIAQKGDPLVGFPVTGGTNDTLAIDNIIGGVQGEFFATDGDLSASDTYLMTFALPVLDLQLELYDFDFTIGSTATLTVYSDASMTTSVGSTFVNSFGGGSDGVDQIMIISSASGPILAASLVFAGTPLDNGEGIDNIRFNTIPEPASLALVALGLAGLAGCGRRRRAA